MRLSRSTATRVVLSVCVLAATLAVAVRTGGNPFALVSDIPPAIYVAIFLCLLFNAITAATRFNFIAARVSRPYRFREAIAIVSASNIAGALFFQVAGQIAARGAIMSRSQSGSFANAVVITAYERVSSAAVSALGALAGAYLVFGHLNFDWASGAPLVKLAIVGLAALACGLALSGAASPILSRLTIRTGTLWGGSFVYSGVVQLPVIAAYMLAAHTLAPQTTVAVLFGATLIVMFAASIPISFAGWGVRELSAVVALGAIGIRPAQAVLTAVLIGLGSMLAAGLCAAATLPAVLAEKPRPSTAVDQRVNYASMLALAVPIAAAIAVPFQVYLPVSGSIINANLADPLAIMGAALFVLHHIADRRMPAWRHSFLGVAAVVATLALGLSLMIGVAHFGLTTWALMNRFAGWFMLLAYFMTGALAVSEHGEPGLSYIAKAFVGSMVAVAGVELILVVITNFVALPAGIVELSAIKGFAQNRNSFAFQLLMAMCVALSLLDRKALTLLIIGFLVGSIALTFSRSGLGTGAMILVGAALLDAKQQRRVLIVAALAGAAALVIYTATGPYHVMDRLTAAAAANFAERMETLTGGLRLFYEHPLFGAGLGAYRNEAHPSTTGEPLVIHSTYIWLLAETGLFGLLAFVTPAAAVVMRELRRVRVDATAAAVVLCFVAMAIMGVPADMLYQRTFWILAGALLIVPGRRLRRASAPEEGGPI